MVKKTAMQEVSDISSPQEMHKDRTQARLNCDAKDLQSIIDYLEERNPLSQNSKELRSLSSVVISQESVNVKLVMVSWNLWSIQFQNT